MLMVAMDRGRDIRRHSHSFEFSPHGITIVALVAMRQRSRPQQVEEGVGCGATRYLAASQQEG